MDPNCGLRRIFCYYCSREIGIAEEYVTEGKRFYCTRDHQKEQKFEESLKRKEEIDDYFAGKNQEVYVRFKPLGYTPNKIKKLIKDVHEKDKYVEYLLRCDKKKVDNMWKKMIDDFYKDEAQ